MQSTPQASRVHISIFGKTNAGKSTLLNALTGQNVALTSKQRGTTTDPVYKPMEIAGIGPCVWIDTAGIDDHTALGKQRVERTRKVMDKTDIAILLFRDENLEVEREWYIELKRRKIPTILVLNVDVNSQKRAFEFIKKIKKNFSKDIIEVDAKKTKGIEQIFACLKRSYQTLEVESSICGELVKAGDVVLLVMPQDIQAPKGRLILPQVQTIRELLDRQCLVQCVTTERVDQALSQMKTSPKLIITDSQLFSEIAPKKPEQSLLTSFSVLFSRYKGDIDAFLEGAKILKQLKPNAKILIAEACSHRPLQEDIGRVKLPRLLKEKLKIINDPIITAGSDFPEDLTEFDLIIHCGACMFNRKHVMSRVARAKKQGIPITNYGVAIAALNGILEDIVY